MESFQRITITREETHLGFRVGRGEYLFVDHDHAMVLGKTVGRWACRVGRAGKTK